METFKPIKKEILPYKTQALKTVYRKYFDEVDSINNIKSFKGRYAYLNQLIYDSVDVMTRNYIEDKFSKWFNAHIGINNPSEDENYFASLLEGRLSIIYDIIKKNYAPSVKRSEKYFIFVDNKQFNTHTLPISTVKIVIKSLRVSLPNSEITYKKENKQ